jgi:hypothetical protein
VVQDVANDFNLPIEGRDRRYRSISRLLGALGTAKVAASALARALLPSVAYVLVMVICDDREQAS